MGVCMTVRNEVDGWEGVCEYGNIDTEKILINKTTDRQWFIDVNHVR